MYVHENKKKQTLKERSLNITPYRITNRIFSVAKNVPALELQTFGTLSKYELTQ